MANNKNRSDIIFQVEKKVPVGSIDKQRLGATETREQYPIPAPKPVPWQED